MNCLYIYVRVEPFPFLDSVVQPRYACAAFCVRETVVNVRKNVLQMLDVNLVHISFQSGPYVRGT